jgi:hypothetical protein
MTVAFLVLALLFGLMAYRTAESFKKQHGVTPWHWPSWTWGLVGFASLLLWAVLFLIARSTTDDRSAISVMPGAGWYPDPHHDHEFRLWDGTRWTDQVEDAGVTHIASP